MLSDEMRKSLDAAYQRGIENGIDALIILVTSDGKEKIKVDDLMDAAEKVRKREIKLLK